MPFINELIPESEKPRLRLLLQSETGRANEAELWKWTIDRERDAFLLKSHQFGGSYEGTEPSMYYLLVVEGRCVSFVARAGSVADTPVNGVLYRSIDNVSIPKGLNPSIVRILIREAFEVQGWLFDRSRVDSVSVVFLESR